MKKFAFIVLCLAAALAAGSGSFFDRAETLQRAASGFASRHGLVEAGVRDKLVALAYDAGGMLAAEVLRAAGTAVPVFLSLLAAAFLVSRLTWGWGRWGRRLLPLAAVLVLAWGAWNGFSVWRQGARDPRLLAPVGLLGKASELQGRVFLDSNSLFLAPLFAPQKLEPGASLESAARLSASTVDWRAEDRKSPFAGVVLTGLSSRSAPLLEMLQASPGWRIAVIDHHGVLLVRGDRGIEEPSPETARKEFRDSSDQAVYLARSALVMKSLERSAAAGQLMAAAQSLDGKNPAVLLCAGSLAAQEGRWSAAREAAEQALQAMPSSAQAAYLLALAQFESGALSKASAQIQKLADRHPEDFQILQLQARIAKANNDPSTEVDALEKLLALSKKRRLLPGNLHILLGQAWAKRGFPDQALQNYQAALDANPPPELKTQIEEAMAVIRKNIR